MFINLGGTGLPCAKKSVGEESKTHGSLFVPGSGLTFSEPATNSNQVVSSNSQLMGSKQWVVVPLPSTYSAANWPIRVNYNFVDYDLLNFEVVVYSY